MYSPSFAYHRASSLADAQQLLAANPGAKILAGGHSLLPLMKLRLAAPSALVDIGRVAELQGISTADGGVRIGAMTTYAALAASDVLRSHCPVVVETVPLVGDPAVRNRGTIGGSVAHADPAADFPTLLVALGATFEIAGATDRRTVAAADFFLGMMATALDEGEVLTAIWVPATATGTGAAYEKFRHPASRYRRHRRRRGRDGTRRRVHRRRGRGRRPGADSATPGGSGSGAHRQAARRRDHRQRRRPGRRRARRRRARRHLRVGGVPPRGRRHLRRPRPDRRGRARVTPPRLAESVDDVQRRLDAQGYVADRALAVSVYLALTLRRPLFLEGEAGVGKTAVARVLAAALGTELIRLQCYEGLDVHHAVYEWNYARQLLEVRLLEASHAVDRDRARQELFSEPYLIRRPLLRALGGAPGRPPVLLIDEIDRADEEFEGYLLELLSEFTITIPEIGAIAAVEPPVVILTSNRTREVHDALKRRCLYQWIDYPSFDKELAIVERAVPQASAALAGQVTALVQELRTAELYKTPGISETLDWVAALVALDREVVDVAAIEDTLGVLLKSREDVEAMRGDRLSAVVSRAMMRGVRHT